MVRPMPVLELLGDAFERGVAHGRFAATAIRRYWEEMLRDVGERVANPMSEGELRDWLRQKIAFAARIEPGMAEEVRGVAIGADVDLDVAWAIGFGEEIGDLAGMLEGPSTPRCLGIVVPPSRSSTGGWLLAQSWDGPEWSDDAWAFVVHDDEGVIAYTADPGWLGGPGINARGIASVHTSVPTVASPAGLPYPFLARRILRAGDAEEAAIAVSTVTQTTGCNWLIAAGSDETNVRAAHDRTARWDLDGLFTTCTHFDDPTWADLEQGVPDSHFRADRLRALADGHALLTPDEVLGLYADHAVGRHGYAVCQHAGAGWAVKGVTVVDAATSSLWLRPGLPCSGAPVTRITLRPNGTAEWATDA